MQIMLLRIWGKYIEVSQKTKHEADPEDKLIKKCTEIKRRKLLELFKLLNNKIKHSTSTLTNSDTLWPYVVKS